MTPAELTKLRLTLKRNGYAPLPACGKEVYLSGWPTKVDVSEAEIASWAEQHPEWSNTGINTRDVPAVDIDIMDPEAATACEDSMRDWFDGRGTIAPRFGTLPKRTILLRTAAPFRKIRADFVAPNGATHHIEILGDGQQTIVFGFNRDAKRAYSWHGDRSPLNTPRGDLPEIDEDEARELINFLSDMLVEKFGFARKEDTTPPTGNEDSSPFISGQKLDVDACLANMEPSGAGANDAQTSAILSLLQKAIHPDDIVAKVVDATMRMADRANLGWSREVEVKKATSRCSSSLKHLHKEYDARTGVIPPWLAGEFHTGGPDTSPHA
jgi:Bifunctional DNA primase/polymerase, N-terminal